MGQITAAHKTCLPDPSQLVHTLPPSITLCTPAVDLRQVPQVILYHLDSSTHKTSPSTLSILFQQGRVATVNDKK